MIRTYLLGGFLLLTEGIFAQSAHELLREGDAAYAKKEYTAAQKNYAEAVTKNPGSGNAVYNLGCTQFQQGKYPEAEKSFEQAVAGDQLPDSKADGLYNLGNARLKQRKYREAIEAYENSLRLRPGDAAAKTNLQIAKQNLQKQKEEEQQKRQQENQDAGQQPDQQTPPNQNDQNQDQQQPGETPPKQGDQPDQQQPSGNTPPGKMSKQEAQRLLETTIGPEDRKSARKYRAVVRKTAPKSKQKDW